MRDSGNESATDHAPTVYSEDGTPLKVRVVGHECIGEVSGEGHWGYEPSTTSEEKPTVYFQEVDLE